MVEPAKSYSEQGFRIPLKRMPTISSPNQPKFTVQNQPKVERLETRKTAFKESSWFLSILKFIVVFLISIGLLATVVASKLAIVGIGQQLNATKISCSLQPANCIKEKQNETPYIMMVMVIMIPQFFTFIKALASSAFCNSEPWPTKGAAIWGIVSAVAEVIGLCMFTLVIATTECNASKVLILMNGIYLFPTSWQMLKQIYKRCVNSDSRPNLHDYHAFREGFNDSQNDIQMSKWNIFFTVVALLCALAGMAYAIYIEITDKKNAKDPISVASFMLLLSFAWCPKIRKLQILAKRSVEHNNEEDEIFDDENRELCDWQRIRVKTARERITVITSLVKLFLTPFIAAAFAKGFNLNVKFKHLDDGFRGLRNGNLLPMLITQIVCSFFARVLAYLACTLGLQKICFALPLIVSTPLSIVLVGAFDGCKYIGLCMCETKLDTNERFPTIILAVLLCLAQIFSTIVYIWQSQQFKMAKDDMLFWLPGYEGVLVEQSLILNRKNEATDDYFVNYRQLMRRSCIYICTTMYHEADFEMEQLLHSIAAVDAARRESERQFESHIFLDDGVRGEAIKRYALQLISLLPKTLHVQIKTVGNKVETPYGMQLRWRLPGGMPFVLHLKDNQKVKNKKRWSQVMYMSYVLDFKRPRSERIDDMTYILTTDADVKFSPDDVSALMDLMMRNPKVGAVCGRTRPMGAGPLVWYQIFDYAVGHWLLKVANHVFGSVLCSPGCFSVYRATAVRDVLPIYSTGIDSAMDFLTKDMGEDRWLCTLMVEAGWRLEYCAAAENSTYCPDNFDEFFKQRRRWGPSTIANQALLINQQTKVRQNNDMINFLFILYQIVLMVSTVIGPATVILILGGGLTYSYQGLSSSGIFISLFLVVAFFIIICLKTKQDTQLKVAKLLTFAFAVVMAIAIVGIILKTVRDVGGYIEYERNLTKSRGSNFTFKATRKEPLMFAPTSWYLLSMIGFFFLTSILHGFEFMDLIHGLWYLLCLPSGYLLLTIYSAANLTDRSWGTREGKVASGDKSDWTKTLTAYFKHFCWCCIPPSKRPQVVEEEQQSLVENEVNEAYDAQNDSEGEITDGEESGSESASPKPDAVVEDDHTDGARAIALALPDPPARSALKKTGSVKMKKQMSVDDTDGFRFPGQRRGVRFAAKIPRLRSAVSIEDFLPVLYQDYVELFKRNGYDNASFLLGLKEKDLIHMGITNRGHRKKIMLLIDTLPPEDFEEEVPDDVEEWLARLGLEDYWPMFQKNSYTEPRELADLKSMDIDSMKKTFNIQKEGHLKKLMNAVKKLQYLTAYQKLIREARKDIEKIHWTSLEAEDNGNEFRFWTELRDLCLLPEQAAFGQSQELKEKLSELRDSSLGVLIVGNVLWLTFMLTVMNQGSTLEVMGSDFASVAFLFVYFLVLLAQVFAMILHRCETLVHLMARTPFKPGKFVRNWSFNDAEVPEIDPDVMEEIWRRRRNSSPGRSPTSSRSDLVIENHHRPINNIA